MKVNFIKSKSTDNIIHQGLLFSPDDDNKKNIIIHIHGMAGNFYENTFIPIMAQSFTEKGLSFLVCNNRGHDYFCDLKKYTNENVISIKGGSAYEIIEESVFDIEGLYNFAIKAGYKNILLQGHSSGANKIVYTLSKIKLDILGVILISPCDDIGIHINAIGNKKRTELIQLAKKLINENKGHELMPEGTFFSYMLSANTYIDSFTDNSALDTFPYRNPSSTFKEFSSINVPILITFGNDGEFLLETPEYIYDLLNEKKNPLSKLNFNIIDNASHSYNFQEMSLTKTIINWIVSNF